MLQHDTCHGLCVNVIPSHCPGLIFALRSLFLSVCHFASRLLSCVWCTGVDSNRGQFHCRVVYAYGGALSVPLTETLQPQIDGQAVMRYGYVLAEYQRGGDEEHTKADEYALRPIELTIPVVD